jgi:hypothetical protein
MYTRIILVKVKEDATAEQKQGLIDAMKALEGIPAVKSAIAGENVGPRPEGYHIGCVLTFDDVEGKNSYEPHDLHRSMVGDHLSKIREGVILFDIPS